MTRLSLRLGWRALNSVRTFADTKQRSTLHHWVSASRGGNVMRTNLCLGAATAASEEAGANSLPRHITHPAGSEFRVYCSLDNCHKRQVGWDSPIATPREQLHTLRAVRRITDPVPVLLRQCAPS